MSLFGAWNRILKIFMLWGHSTSVNDETPEKAEFGESSNFWPFLGGKLEMGDENEEHGNFGTIPENYGEKMFWRLEKIFEKISIFDKKKSNSRKMWNSQKLASTTKKIVECVSSKADCRTLNIPRNSVTLFLCSSLKLIHTNSIGISTWPTSESRYQWILASMWRTCKEQRTK